MLNLESVIMARSDRRTEKRQETAEHIDLYLDGEFFATCRLRDLCSSGAFIETDMQDSLPVGTTMEMHFPLARGSGVTQKALCMQAVVARIAAEGVGVMITNKSLVPLGKQGDTVVI